ncbi:D-inositol 3-phosphate glycosyltransferase [Allorhodopirellula solitaria]|uniref:D-inositol 3-phosphate glycosyltransferase n=2 Tax=Allorhodopirellula solitaria TaxID=2527987 RepID=A0A5C5YHJ0_9BACT|nr:D-inositol 3-phosphate glycosyltransferase [Allorhodopirellula solitaria]
MLDPWALRQGRWKKRVAGWWFGQRVLDQAGCLHALNESELQSMRAFGCRNPICVIPNGIDLPELDGALSVKPASWREQTADRKVLLYIGRIHPKKGLENLLRAWAMLDRSLREAWVLPIVGWDQGGHEAELRELAETLGVSDSVLFLGPRFGDDKDRLLRAADGFVHTSFSEGLPMAILEAWAYQLPVVMTPQCNLPIGFARQAAISVTTDVDAVRVGIEELMRMTDRGRESMGEAGRRLVEEEFSWPKIARETQSVYQWLLGGDRPDCVSEV